MNDVQTAVALLSRFSAVFFFTIFTCFGNVFLSIPKKNGRRKIREKSEQKRYCQPEAIIEMVGEGQLKISVPLSSSYVTISFPHLHTAMYLSMVTASVM